MSDANEGSARIQRVLARSVLFFRLGGLVQVAFSAWVDVGRYRQPWLVFALVAAVATESGLLSAAANRLGDIRSWWVGADTLFCAAGLLLGAWLTAPAYAHTWAYFMYPFTIVASFVIGITFRRLDAVLAWVSVLAVAYLLAATGIHGDPMWNAAPNMLTYFPNTVVAWAIARALRQNGRELDRSRSAAIAQATELAQERERVRQSRVLHDRVLQTMEALSRGHWINDPELVAHVSAEAAWLRGWLEGTSTDDRDLLVGLRELVYRKARIGLRVELNGTALRTPGAGATELDPATVVALLQATDEALSNVTKHAGVDQAVVRVSTGGASLVLSVLDRGCGFDPSIETTGIGLRESVRARITEVAGTVRIESSPGTGTYVELSVPLQPAKEKTDVDRSLDSPAIR
jgi:signal transduction histidine kinase